MEIALVPLLYYMIKDASKAIGKSNKIQYLLEKLTGIAKKDVSVEDTKQFMTDLETYEIVMKKTGTWTPFWASKPSSSADAMAEEKMVVKEFEAIEQDILAKSKPDAIVLSTTQASALEKLSKMSKLEGYREYVYFLLEVFNF